MHLDPDPGIEERLAATLAAIGPSTPQALLAATFWHDDNRAMAVPYLWRMSPGAGSSAISLCR